MKRDPGSGEGSSVFRFDGARFSAHEHHPVSEFPVRLTVNGNPLATLIASPHNLEFLVAGFLRMQGLVASREDIEILGVCPDSGTANVRIRGEVPGRLTPILTSGCTGGVTFHLPWSAGSGETREQPSVRNKERCSPSDVLRAMEGLGRVAGRYRSTGGIHSSAVADGDAILLHAEDIGRHNTIDRIAGEALLKGIDLAGKILVTSGRISSEMAAKGAALGVSVMASRTSPSDMAIRIALEAGIALIGYVRGGRFTVYSHPWRISLAPKDSGLEEGVTGGILAGGPGNLPPDVEDRHVTGWVRRRSMIGKAVSFVAESGTGKTTLLEKVIAELKARGYRVGVIKHDAHRFEIDHPGKDSFRLTAAGADTMVITSPGKLALVRGHAVAPSVGETIETYFGDVDIVLTEGFRKSGLPKIEVHRRERSAELLCKGRNQDPTLLAVASDEPLSLDVPVFDLNDPAAIADFLVDIFLAASR